MKNMLAVEIRDVSLAKLIAEHIMERGLFVAFDPVNEGEAILWIKNTHDVPSIAKMVTKALGLPDKDRWLTVVKDIRHEREL